MSDLARLVPLGRLPVHPPVAALTFVLALYSDSTAALETLPRPLFVAAAAALAVQLVGSLVVRNRHVGAIIALVCLLGIAGLTGLAVAVLGIPLAFVVASVAFRRGVPSLPWARMTELLNGVTILILVFSVATAWQAGALVPVTADRVPLGRGSGPDVFLILLDAYPRADTLLTDFGYDNEPFLSEMERLGFDVAREARSNYNLTALTLASMLNMEHIADVDTLADAPKEVRAQYRAVTRAMNGGRALDWFRGMGYEIVTVPPPFSDVTLYTADRIVDGGGLTEFEAAILQSGLLRLLVPDFLRTWLTDDARSRITVGLDRTASFASERGGPPKLVLTHLLSPHEPILFGADGSPRQGWPCFPTQCSLFDGGQRYGDEIKPSTIGQVEHLNRLIVDTTRRILADSDEPPVIIVFSDHGHRHLSDDPHETVKSILLAYTPGYPGLVPNDGTPVNLLARILNAYNGTSLPLVSEESYMIDVERIETDGILGFSVSVDR